MKAFTSIEQSKKLAEKKAKERYWLEPYNIDTQNKYHAYIEGYEQAVKDLALTWFDGLNITDVDAIEIEVKEDAGGYPYIDAIELYDYDKDIPLAKKGDKVNVIIMTRE